MAYSLWDMVLASQAPTIERGYPWDTGPSIEIIAGEFATAEIASILAGTHGPAFLPPDLPATAPKLLCETCFDTLTDRVVTLDGLDQAQCGGCAP